LSNFKINRLGQGSCYLSVSYFFVPHFGMSAWHLKCTKHMGLNVVMLFSEEYVRTEGGWAKRIGYDCVSQAVVKIVLNPRVL